MPSKDLRKVLSDKYERKIVFDNEELHFEFYGDRKENGIDENKLNSVIDNVFYTKNFLDPLYPYDSLKAIVYSIRIILNQYEEKYLLVSLRNRQTNDYEKVIIENKEVTEFKRVFPSDLSTMVVDYHQHTGIAMTIQNKNQPNFINFLNLNNMYAQNFLSASFQTIQDISEIKMLSNLYFSEEEKTLIDLYQMFFNTNPDFSNEEIVNKTHAMMSILWDYNVALPNENGFYMNAEKEYPYSNTIQLIAKRLSPFGEIDTYGGSQITFGPKVNNMILKLGESINKFCDNYFDTLEEKNALLKNISVISYIIREYVNSVKFAKIEDIAFSNFVNCDIEMVRDIIQLLTECYKIINANPHTETLIQYEALCSACEQCPNMPKENKVETQEKDYLAFIHGEPFMYKGDEEDKFKIFYLNETYFNQRLAAIYERSKTRGEFDALLEVEPRYQKDHHLIGPNKGFLIQTFKNYSNILGQDFEQTELYDRMIVEKKEEEAMIQGYCDGYETGKQDKSLNDPIELQPIKNTKQLRLKEQNGNKKQS